MAMFALIAFKLRFDEVLYKFADIAPTNYAA
jgi:hypothetical protein